MALVNCKECGGPVSTAAANCPKCGAPVPSAASKAKELGGQLWLVTKLLVGGLFFYIVYQCTAITGKMADAPGAPERLAQVLAPSPPTTPPIPTIDAPSEWYHQTQDDPLSKRPTKAASLSSIDQLSLDFPYKGENRGHLWVRQSPRDGLTAYFSIDKGQLICHYGDNCQVSVSFDEAKPVTFRMIGAADSDSTVLFFSDAKRFIAGATRAKEIRVAAIIYQGGQPTLTFRATSPLVWPPK